GQVQILADSVTFGGGAGSITGTGSLVFGPASSAASIGIGSAAGAFKITQAQLDTFSGVSSQTIGDFNNAASLTIDGPVNFARTPTLQANPQAGTISLAPTAIVVLPAGQSFNLSAGGAVTMSSGAAITAGTLTASGSTISFASDFTALETAANQFSQF